MTATEMNNLFRLRLDEVSSLSTKSYEDEEVSDILTQAQLRIVKRYANVYEKNEYARKALSKIVTGPEAFEYVNSDAANQGEPTNLEPTALTPGKKLDNGNIMFRLPHNVLRVVYEELVHDGTSYDVFPTTHDEYRRVRRNKYRKPNSRKVLRFDVQAFEEDGGEVGTDGLGHELITDGLDFNLPFSYIIRYIQNPQPIVYSQVPSEIRDCYLSDFIHDEIVDEAVLIALEISKEQRLQTFAQVKQGNNG